MVSQWMYSLSSCTHIFFLKSPWIRKGCFLLIAWLSKCSKTFMKVLRSKQVYFSSGAVLRLVMFDDRIALYAERSCGCIYGVLVHWSHIDGLSSTARQLVWAFILDHMNCSSELVFHKLVFFRRSQRHTWSAAHMVLGVNGIAFGVLKIGLCWILFHVRIVLGLGQHLAKPCGPACIRLQLSSCDQVQHFGDFGLQQQLWVSVVGGGWLCRRLNMVSKHGTLLSGEDFSHPTPCKYCGLTWVGTVSCSFFFAQHGIQKFFQEQRCFCRGHGWSGPCPASVIPGRQEGKSCIMLDAIQSIHETFTPCLFTFEASNCCKRQQPCFRLLALGGLVLGCFSLHQNQISTLVCPNAFQSGKVWPPCYSKNAKE